MVYQTVAMAVTLNDFEGHSPVADVFTCNPLNICAAFYTISTDSVLAWFLWISRASCQQLSQKTATIFQLTQRVARLLCNSRTSCIVVLSIYWCTFINCMYVRRCAINCIRSLWLAQACTLLISNRLLTHVDQCTIVVYYYCVVVVVAA